MKTKQLSKKLTLNKTTVTHLENDQMNAVKGGATYVGSWCYGCNSQPPKCSIKIGCWE